MVLKNAKDRSLKALETKKINAEAKQLLEGANNPSFLQAVEGTKETLQLAKVMQSRIEEHADVSKLTGLLKDNYREILHTIELATDWLRGRELEPGSQSLPANLNSGPPQLDDAIMNIFAEAKLYLDTVPNQSDWSSLSEVESVLDELDGYILDLTTKAKVTVADIPGDIGEFFVELESLRTASRLWCEERRKSVSVNLPSLSS